MDKVTILRRYGLFDRKVPRYTSFPPANRFGSDTGARFQKTWLQALPAEMPVSVYVHIPFCRRLCWFCACRTQGTRNMAPVESYVDDLIQEIETVRALLPQRLMMRRLHLGGGTPTLLRGRTIRRLIHALRAAFDETPDFEFSIEIDPTEAAPDVLDSLVALGLNRASVGVQDFNPAVQKAIGRRQGFAETRAVIDRLRADGVSSLNIDVLYGLPYQTRDSLTETLRRVLSLSPDRIALYGYAHVPHVAKRQVMIPQDLLPDGAARYDLAEMAHDHARQAGMVKLGIDHFAKPDDGLAIAAREGRLRRNFQGYTDDPCATILGFGASAISQFAQGYTQNAAATAAYLGRIRETGLAGHRGHALTTEDIWRADLISAVMCEGRVDFRTTRLKHRISSKVTSGIATRLLRKYPDLLDGDLEAIVLRPGFEAAARLIAAEIDQPADPEDSFSMAI